MAVAPITARLNTPVDQIGDKALERARRDFQDTVRKNATTNLQPQTQTDTGGQDEQRRRGGPAVFGETLGARVLPADPRDRARLDANRRARADVRPSEGPGQSTRAPAAQPNPIGPPIPRELLPQLPTPPPGSSLVAEGLTGRSDLIHHPARGTERMQAVKGEDALDAEMQTRPATSANPPQYRLNSAAPPEIASRIAAFMRTGQLDRRPFAVTPVPGLIPDETAGKQAGAAMPADTMRSAQIEPVDLLSNFEQSKRPRVMPSLPVPMQAETIATMPAGQFAPARAADHRLPVSAVSQRANDDEEAEIRARDALGRMGTNPFFADAPADDHSPGPEHTRTAAGPANPLFAR